MPRPLWKTLLLSLFAGLFFSALWIPARSVWARPRQAPAYQYIDPFLYPPYPGTATENSIFDHSSPNYSQTDNRIVAFTGDQADKLCPSPAPAGKAPPQAGVCDAGSGIYWSYSLGDWLSYNGHDGIDFGIEYRPVFAAADADQVAYAGWTDPMDHSYSLGLSVKLHHSNGYTTSYGHMSAVAIQSCGSVGCADIPHGELIGYSGSTGNSTGPHLHFGVGSPAKKSVDPYGWWAEDYADPWPYDQRNSLWVQYPSVIPYYGSSATVLPTDGVPLPYPAPASNAIVVDDGSSGFSESPSGCWTVTATSTGQSENGSMRYVQPVITGAATCTAFWNFPSGQPAGEYALYVRIPAIHASSEGARYNIIHMGRTEMVTIDQGVFPNPYYVTDGWLYIGKYDFAAGGNEYVSLSNLTQDTASTYQTHELGVDAVRFVYLSGTVPTNTPTDTYTPLPTRTPTNTFTPSRTYTPSSTYTPSRTRTPGPTPTPTRTRRPTDTRWPTWTPSLSRTPRPTDTRWPTLTRTNAPNPSPTRTPTFTRTPTNTRTPTSTRTGTKTPGPSPTRTPYYTDTRWPTRTLRPTDTRWPTPTPRP